jgi:membrane protein implicated in regulation of membrane protease activity
MTEWFDSLTHLQTVFFVFATIGSVLFVVQLVLILIGGGDADAEMDLDGGDLDTGDMVASDVDGDMDIDHDHPSSDASFKLLSYQGLTAFFMMFGLVGLAMNRGSEQGGVISVVVAISAGFSCMWLVAKLFKFFHGLQSSGTINLKNAMGQSGRVYLTIKPDAPGQIEIEIQGHLKIYEAVSEDKEVLPTDTRIKVVAVNGTTMVVKRL